MVHLFESWDVSLYRALNAFCGTSPALDRVVYHLAGPTGVVLLGLFGLLWFRGEMTASQHYRCEVVLRDTSRLGAARAGDQGAERGQTR